MKKGGKREGGERRMDGEEVKEVLESKERKKQKKKKKR